MVRQHAPVPQPAPSGPMRWQTDQAIAYERLGRERSQERRKIASAEMTHAFRQVSPGDASDGPRFDPGDLSAAFQERMDRKDRTPSRSRDRGR